MAERSLLLTVDAAANLLFGVALLTFPAPFFDALGLPRPGHALYPTILGAVLVSIGVALLRESRRRGGALVGLGLFGAVAINLAAGLAIAVWLLFADTGAVTGLGRAVLFVLVLFLVGLSVAELVAQRMSRTNQAPER